ncbi:MAG: Stp1/IreP family PP2C-type Ser/Thr phosphatase [Clostridiales bacterium]|nr:Stp1/IreP family PP2C-type Ser/Thr phosphatase [Clostridiales bacterium]
MRATGKTHVGLVRKNNQDFFFITDGLYIIADGMGGHNGGEIASSQAVKLLKQALKDKEPAIETLEKAIIQVNSTLFEMQLKEESLSGMGTTLTVLWEKSEELLLGHVGDSRAYLFREDRLVQITQDHSIVAEMVRQGLLTKSQAKKHPYRNVVTRAVGSAEEIEVDTLTLERKPKDIWLLCSDGLTSMVPDEKIYRTIKENPLEEALEKLLKKALEQGGKDNVSIVLLQEEEVVQ